MGHCSQKSNGSRYNLREHEVLELKKGMSRCVPDGATKMLEPLERVRYQIKTVLKDFIRVMAKLHRSKTARAQLTVKGHENRSKQIKENLFIDPGTYKTVARKEQQSHI